MRAPVAGRTRGCSAACLAQRAHGRGIWRPGAPAARARPGDRDPRGRDRVQSAAGFVEHACRGSRVLESPRASRHRGAVGRLSLERLRRRGVERRGGRSLVRQAGSSHRMAAGDPDRREPRGVPRRARRDDGCGAGGTTASGRRPLWVREPRRDGGRSIQPLRPAGAPHPARARSACRQSGPVRGALAAVPRRSAHRSRPAGRRRPGSCDPTRRARAHARDPRAAVRRHCT